MSGFRELIYWQKARQLVQEVYRISAAFPTTEQYGLSLQLRRAVVSIPSNIAEGYGRASRAEYVRFLNIARGSCYEVETQLILALDLGFLNEEKAMQSFQLCAEIGKMLNAAIHSLEH